MDAKPQHTAGPVFLEGNWQPGTDSLGGWLSSFPPAGMPMFEMLPVLGEPSEICASARLVSAAYNAFDSAAKRLEINAVQMAERVQEGGLADLVEAGAAVIATWETGDLAGAVRGLEAALKLVRGAA